MSSKRRADLLLSVALLVFLSLGVADPSFAQEPPGPHPDAWLVYHDHQRLSQELAQLAAAFPDLMTVESVGRSVQGRDIWLVTITNQGVPGDKTKVFFDGSMHGSEVIAAESMLHYIKFLVQQYSTNPTAREIVDGWITYVIPMVNPDGVETGKSSDDYRLARKNANLVDLNRNFDWDWPPDCGPNCASPCRPTCFQYPGPAAFSEAESQIIRDQIIAKQPLVYLSGHAGLSSPQLIRPGVFDPPAEEDFHIAIQDCVRTLVPDFRSTSGNQGGAAKNWIYGVPMQALRDAGLHPLAFNLETYSLSAVTPGMGNHFWWCRYNPPAAEDDSVWQWCLNGTGFAPLDTLVSRMEKVKTALIYITQSATGARPCSAPAIAWEVNRAIAASGLSLAAVDFAAEGADGCSALEAH